MDEDDWDLGSDGDSATARQDQSDREWESLRAKHLKMGYALSAPEAREKAAQQGFNEGFSEALTIFFPLSVLRGRASALVEEQRSDGDSAIKKQRKELQAVIADIDNLAKRPEQVDTSSEGGGCCGGGCSNTEGKCISEADSSGTGHAQCEPQVILTAAVLTALQDRIDHIIQTDGATKVIPTEA